MPATLIIICGLPGSGKTTLARRLEIDRRCVRMCPDDWMIPLGVDIYDETMRAKIESLQWELARRLLALGVSVIVEWGTWARSERDELRLGARALGARVELRYLSAPVEVLYARIQARGMEDPPIDREAMSQWSEIFQEPTAEELALFDEPLDR